MSAPLRPSSPHSRAQGLEVPAALPKARPRHVNLAGRAADGRLVHLGLSDRIHSTLANRMDTYARALYRDRHTMPEQLVVYVGEPPCRTGLVLNGPLWAPPCRVIDIRDLSTPNLLAAAPREGNISTVLAHLANQHLAIRRILPELLATSANQRPPLLRELLSLAGLQPLSAIRNRNFEPKPPLLDINRHTIFGPIYRQGFREGYKKGFKTGLLAGRREAARNLALSLLA